MRLPGGGPALGALHEVPGGGNGAIDGAAAALFAAGIAARPKRPVLWCVIRQDLFAPAISRAGLAPDRVVYAEAEDEKAVLACCEEGLRHGGLGSVVAEIGRLTMTNSRRLQLAAESAGTLGTALRRWRRQSDAVNFGRPTAAATSWRVTVLHYHAHRMQGERHAVCAIIPSVAVKRTQFQRDENRAKIGLDGGLVFGSMIGNSHNRLQCGKFNSPTLPGSGPLSTPIGSVALRRSAAGWRWPVSCRCLVRRRW